ncbi:MAG: hypothetical protein AAB772_00825, partial [Patescibacteria group bacterium]
KIKESIIQKAIQNFKGLEHRLEFVRAIKLKNRATTIIIEFYNDSASTNPQTAAAALQSFKEQKILIAGGKDKNLDYAPLAKTVKNSNTLAVILFGENKNKIKKAIAKTGVNIIMTTNLRNALWSAYKQTNKLTHSVNSGLVLSKAEGLTHSVNSGLVLSKAEGLTHSVNSGLVLSKAEGLMKLKAESLIVLFSPASASFDMFTDYKERGKVFKKLVKNIAGVAQSG